MKKLSIRYVSVALIVACMGQMRGSFIFMRGDGSKECRPGMVIPAIVQDICTTCGTKSCTVCAKCTSGCPTCRRSEDSVDISRCLSCNTCADIENNGRCVQCNRRDSGRLPCLGEERSCVRKCAPPCETAHTIFIPRSVGANTARELVGWQDLIHRCTGGKAYVTTAHSVGFAHSLRPERIARFLFGDLVLRFSGSEVKDRGTCDFLADNFGLSTRFKGRLEVKPTIENIFLDNQIYVGLDNICCGLYVRAHAPLVHTRWDLRMCEQVEDKGRKEFPACLMGEGKVRALRSIKEALRGRRVVGAISGAQHFGRFADRRLTRTGLADIDLIVGWDFLKCDTYHLGLYGLVVAPTGNKPNNRFIFEPIVGNGKHLEVGAGVSGHLILWEEGIDQSLGIYFEGNVTHFFKNRQCRSFDLCNKGPLSRFMLLKEFKREGESIVPTGRLVSGINFTTREVEVSVPVKGDISVKLAYRSPCIGIDLGYNFYGNAREKLEFRRRRNEQLVGIKGTESVCVLEHATIGTEQPLSFGSLIDTVPSNTTQSAATSLQGGPVDNGVAFPVPPDRVVVTALSRQKGLIVGQDIVLAQVSQPPVLLSERDLNKESGRAEATATHKVFGYIGYVFNDFCGQRWCIPYLGLGGELEVEALACDEQTSLNQWSVWVKGGFEF